MGELGDRDRIATKMRPDQIRDYTPVRLAGRVRYEFAGWLPHAIDKIKDSDEFVVVHFFWFVSGLAVGLLPVHAQPIVNPNFTLQPPSQRI